MLSVTERIQNFIAPVHISGNHWVPISSIVAVDDDSDSWVILSLSGVDEDRVLSVSHDGPPCVLSHATGIRLCAVQRLTTTCIRSPHGTADRRWPRTLVAVQGHQSIHAAVRSRLSPHKTCIPHTAIRLRGKRIAVGSQCRQPRRASFNIISIINSGCCFS